MRRLGMSLDRTAAMLGITDSPDRLTRVEQFLEDVMLGVARRVRIEARFIEVELRVNGVVHLTVNPSVSQRTGIATSRSGETVPIVTVREADTVARVRQGETVVIAGLLQAREPAGSVKRKKTDLVILLTPTLMAR